MRLLGRWSIGILDFYAQTTPTKFVILYKEIAKWAIWAFHEEKYVAPVVRLHTFPALNFLVTKLLLKKLATARRTVNPDDFPDY